MPETNPTPPAFCVALHDVAPSTWDAYAGFVAAIGRLNIPLTLLVTPDYHRQGTVERHPAFVRAIGQRLESGDEVVLHGYYHDDPGPLGFAPQEWFMRRIYTYEGEFYRLAEAEALRRLQQGLDMFARLGWRTQGFTPPAWLLGAGARRALQQSSLSYASTIHTLIRLPTFAELPAPSLVWSSRSAWRRGLSRIWGKRMLARSRTAPFLRLGLHPVDMQYPAVQAYWLETVHELAATRQPMTKAAWLEQQA
ncbi:polysaccharide deacetylase family protein [Candidatus Thiothrix sp. Deng01]|uniref:Polysaccharide deacetylase family protein n=1 Tax=Candidatus Thiothrix phosphatis TaxID=3112415 RepID=A0ABU6CXR0_9GAMM|nr:polysaccharide deacetylase family protein [Candidatus Thiothrix sp. Deng01]MEB4591616.1 polysaccharide deacetylase family protein [Candidatus Thiothrix sp. Deng01]